MIQIKICGVTRRADALAAADCGADALGFIFHPDSPRYAPPDTVRAICRELPGGLVRVGVFVNAEAAEIAELADYCGIDMIQLHGDESPGDCRRFPAERLIKAVSGQSGSGPAGLERYPVRAMLLDHREAGRYGGTGKTPDWGQAGRIRTGYPLILAGGLHAGNIEEALRTVAPDAVDINSGVERAPGEKDHEKVREIIEIIRSSIHADKNARRKRPFRRFRGPLCRRNAHACADRA